MSAAGLTKHVVEVRRAQIASDPENVPLRLLLARALRVDTVRGLYNDPKIGLIDQGIGRNAEALNEITAALELAPEDPELHEEKGELLLVEGRTLEAVAHLRRSLECRPDAQSALRLGIALQHPEIADFEGASDAYRLALEIDPQARGAASRLSSVSVRTEDLAGWNFLMGQQARDPDPERDTLFAEFDHYLRDPRRSGDGRALVDRLGEFEMADGRFDTELVRSIAARLQYIGQFSLAFDVKRFLALRRLKSTQGFEGSIVTLESRAQALAYLGRSEELLEMVQLWPGAPKGRREQLIMKKMAADASLTLGDPGPLIDYQELNPPGLPLPGHDKMADLVRGKRVAVVGPSPSGELLGEEIDSFDVVIRPRFTPEFVRQHAPTGGARTDISYYSSTDIGRMRGDIREAAERSDLQLAVARPMLYAALSRDLGNSPWLRFYRHDFGLFFLGSPLGITRILYDIIPFEPGEIRLFNVDLYTGSKAFATGYRDAKDAQIAADSLLNDLFRAHDLRAEFDLMRALYLNGVFTASEMTANILKLPTADYLSLLDRSAAFRG